MVAKSSGNGRHGAGKRKGGRRPVEFIKHPDTEKPVEGMRWHKPTQTAYRIEKNKRIYYRRKGLKGAAYLRRAIREHELGLQGKKPGTLETHISFAVPPERVLRKIKDIEFIMPEDGKPGDMVYDLDDEYCILLRKDAIYDWVREQIENPETRFDFAQRTVPEIAYLDRLRPSDASLPLSGVADLYFNKRKKKISEKTKKENQRYWKEFADLIDVEKIAEISTEHVRNYHDTIYDLYERDERSPDFVSHRFGAIKAILNNATKNGRDLDELHRVLTICKMLEAPDKEDENPQPIERQHYHKLLEAADAQSDSRGKAILLVMLNACMKPEAVRCLRKNEVDLQKGTSIARRKKTGKVIRAAVLWKRTIRAIKKYQEEHPHKAETLFANDNGETFGESSQAVRKIFTKLRNKAGLPETVKAEHIRDGAYTAASANEKEEELGKSRILAGHKVGISDKYIMRHPEIVAGVCKQIEKVYFGGKKK